jgi:hypothetical protein
VEVDALKSEWPEFAAMPRLAMRFRGILRSKNATKLGVWLKEAHQSGLCSGSPAPCKEISTQ